MVVVKGIFVCGISVKFHAAVCGFLLGNQNGTRLMDPPVYPVRHVRREYVWSGRRRERRRKSVCGYVDGITVCEERLLHNFIVNCTSTHRYHSTVASATLVLNLQIPGTWYGSYGSTIRPGHRYRLSITRLLDLASSMFSTGRGSILGPGRSVVQSCRGPEEE